MAAAALRSAPGVIYFSNLADQRLYSFDGAENPQAITPEAEMRYADGVIDRRRNRMICVREDHSRLGAKRSTQSSGFL